MLLACSFYEELHDLVQNFVVDNWVEISQLNEFEVSAVSLCSIWWPP